MRWALFVGWATFGLTMVLVLVSFAVSSRAVSLEIDGNDEQYLEPGATPTRNPHVRSLKIVNGLALIAFFLGVMAVVTFAERNLL